MFTSRGFRLSALLISLILAFSTLGVATAEARFGGSFGSRGMRTTQTVPSTKAVPTTTAPVQRTMTNGQSAIGTSAAAATYRNSWFGCGIGGWIVGGLIFSGLFGMLFGTGFGGFGGILSLLIQFAIIYFVVRWLFRRFGPSPAPAAGPSGYDYAPRQDWQPMSGNARTSGTTSEASRRAGARDEIGINGADLGTFEKRLGELQDSTSREDYDSLRAISTPEMMSYLTEELAQNAAKGLRNEVFDVRLIEGDIAEAWREGERDYASIAMRYESRDVMRDRATGALVSGEDRVVERRAVWTFVRERGGKWLLSAIQGA